jgi:predicted amino acid-binding ACT domain protein
LKEALAETGGFKDVRGIVDRIM